MEVARARRCRCSDLCRLLLCWVPGVAGPQGKPVVYEDGTQTVGTAVRRSNCYICTVNHTC